MSKERERQEVAGWFRQLRQADEQGAPSFEDVLNTARRRAARRPAQRLYLQLAVVATLVLFLALPALWWQMRRQAARHSAIQAASISQWKSPTDFLIETPGRNLLKTVPRIGDGLIDMQALEIEERR